MYHWTHDHAQIFGHLAYALVFFSFLVRSMLRLRIISIAASFSSSIYAFTAAEQALLPPLIWNTLFVSLNAWHIGRILYEQRHTELNALEKFLKERALKAFSANELKSFLAQATRRSFKARDLLVLEGDVLKELFLIASGDVLIEVENKEVARMQGGFFLGEMSFLSKESARASAIGASEGDLLVWTHDAIASWMKNGQGRELLLHKALGLQLLHFLTKKNVVLEKSA